MNRKQFTLTLIILIVASFLGGTLAVLILDSGRAEAAARNFIGIGVSASGNQVWMINTSTGAMRSIIWNGQKTEKVPERAWNNPDA